jgi:hypothetical protein
VKRKHQKRRAIPVKGLPKPQQLAVKVGKARRRRGRS